MVIVVALDTFKTVSRDTAQKSKQITMLYYMILLLLRTRPLHHCKLEIISGGPTKTRIASQSTKLRNYSTTNGAAEIFSDKLLVASNAPLSNVEGITRWHTKTKP